MNWLLSLVRVAGSSFPLASSLVQLQAEVDSAALKARLEKLEDPLSALHPNIREVVGAVFDLYAAKGLGIRSKELGTIRYYVRA